jgi:hypothetical protein
MDEWVDGRRHVDLGGYRHLGGGAAGRRDWQDFQKIIVSSERAGELNERKSMLVKLSTDKTVSATVAAVPTADQ